MNCAAEAIMADLGPFRGAHACSSSESVGAPPRAMRRPVKALLGRARGLSRLAQTHAPTGVWKVRNNLATSCSAPLTHADDRLMLLLPGHCVRRVAAPDMADASTPVAGPNRPVPDRGTPA